MNKKIKKIGKKINEFLIDRFELTVKESTRHSTLFAKKYFNDKKIVAIEIGSYRGFNAKSILKNLNIFKIYLVDPWTEYEEYKKSEKNKKQSHLNNALRECKKRLKKFKNVFYIRKFSDEAIKFVPKADFIYVDGNHEYEYVKKDLEKYYEKLKNKGIIAGHDINWKESAPVLTAVREFCEKKNLKFRASGEDWWIIKGENFYGGIRKKEGKSKS